MECSSCRSTVLDSWSRNTYPHQHHRQSFQCILLLNINTSTPSTIWWNIIWSLLVHVKCHIWKQASIRRWRLWKQFRKFQHTKSSPKTFRIHHVSSIKNASFDPIPVTSCSTRDPQLRPVCRRLIYSSLDDDDIIEDEVPFPFSASQMWNHTHDPCELSSKHDLEAHIHLEEEEDFQTVLLDDEHWTTEEIPDRPLCIHKHSLPYGLCPYPCPYVN